MSLMLLHCEPKMNQETELKFWMKKLNKMELPFTNYDSKKGKSLKQIIMFALSFSGSSWKSK